MNVAELIKRLEQMPQGAVVLLVNGVTFEGQRLGDVGYNAEAGIVYLLGEPERGVDANWVAQVRRQQEEGV